MDAKRFPLSKLLEMVAADIREAHTNATANHDAVMRFESCELELAIDVEEESGGELSIWVMKLGGKTTRNKSNTIKVRYSANGPFVAVAQGPPGTVTSHRRTGKKETR